ncbi:MAG TPA: flagellar export chaperone FliS [Rhodocyclaceae bacterium]|jgi:flagellar protein FliS|nr:flagellar export chaperone FliS [Rhodocyclaceae bacterium]HMW78477.1 flagellar export chaperone FliS [Rhodocyclaceae bacterium]HNE41892.1 flagellar export chaperone FliS [Rhodocyclaceae bacterium]HNM80597.1 flagellar export chaperone FliS [Rhodocyclaceae bacterium]HNP04771.1 flagellar export chaperone FliS [Rhodocyclaceae bacterium]
MFALSNSPLNAYKAVQTDVAVAAASPHNLIVLLFDGALAAIAAARTNLAQGNIEAKGLAVSKAIDIITNGLKVSLDQEAGGELAQNLADLYDYAVRRLVQGNLKNQVAAFDEVTALLNEIRGAWVEIGNRANSESPA